MPREAMITPLTLYNLDNTIFDGIVLPDYHFPRSIEYDDLFLKEGWTLSKDVLINNILLETAELDTIYTNPDFFKFAVSQWAAKEFQVWKSLYETMFYKYNPIWNRDGSVKESESQIRDLVLNNEKNRNVTDTDVNNNSEFIQDTDNIETSGFESGLNNKTEVGNNSSVNSNETDKSETVTGVETESDYNFVDRDGTNTTQLAAFDQMSTWSNRDKATNDSTESTEGERSKNNVGNNTSSENQNGSTNSNENKIDIENNTVNSEGTSDRTYNRNRSGNDSNIHNGSESETNRNTDSGSITTTRDSKNTGNIGLTMTQSLIEAERKLVQFNIYDLIVDSFKARFCLLIY